MASRTQARVQQLTGSIIDIAYSGSVSSAAADTAIAGDHLGSLLGELAGAVGRISGKTGTGASAFTNQAAGVFTHATVKLGSGGNEFEIQEALDNITFDVTTADKDLIFKMNTTNSGDNTEIMRIDGSAESLLIAGTKKIELQDAGTFIHSPADGKILIESDGATDDAIEIKTSNAAGEIVIESAHTAGRAVFIDANAHAGSIVDIDAGILQIEATGVAELQSGGTLSLGTANSGVAINIGHATSEVTIGDNLTVTGDLTVSGDTVTVNTANLSIEDPVILMANGATSANQNGGLALLSGSATADQSLVFGRVANDMWGTGRKDVTGGTVTTLADMTLVNLATKGISIDSTNFAHAIALNGSNLKMGSTGDVEIDPDAGNVLFGDGSNTIVDIDVAEPKITIHDDANVNDKFEIAVAANGVTTLTTTDADAALANFSVVADGTITLDSAGDIVLDADGQDIFLKDGGTEYGNIRLNVNADGMDGNDIVLSSSLGNLGLDAASSMVVFMNDGTQFLYLEHQNDDAKIYPAGNGQNDIVFEDGAESSNEVFRVDGALQALAMPQQNAAGNAANTGILSFNSNNDVNEAIYGDGGALYLRSNAVNFKLPTADGTADQVLVTDGAGTLSFADANATLAKFVFKATEAVAAGDVNLGSSKTTGITALSVGNANLNITNAQSALNDSLEVYINGQLLVSGSDGGSDTDYTFIDADTLKFAFGLETDDIIQVIQR